MSDLNPTPPARPDAGTDTPRPESGQRRRVNGFSIAALVLGIAAALLSVIPGNDSPGRVIVALLAVAFGVVGIVFARRLGGLVLAIIGLCLGAVLTITGLIVLIGSLTGPAAAPEPQYFDRADLEDRLQQEVEDASIVPLDDVTCPSNQPMAVGTKFDCNITTIDGSSAVVHVKVRSDKGSFSWTVN